MEPGGSQSPQIHNAFVKTAKKVIVLSIYYCQIKSRTDGYLEEEGKGSEDRPFSRNPESLPNKRKIAQKEKYFTMPESLMSSLRAVAEC